MGPLAAFLRRILNLQALVCLGGDFTAEGDAVLRVRRRRNAKARCPIHRCPLQGDLVRRTKRWRHLNFAQTKVFLEAEVREGRCPRCDGRRVESVPWASGRAEHTSVFDRYVARLVQITDKTAVSMLAGLAWRTVGRIIERVVDALGRKNQLDDLVGISVDETAYKRGHRYLTVVVNLENGEAIWAAKGKSSATLGKFFDELGQERCAKLQVVAMDMSGGYEKAVRERCPQAELVYDRFHVVKLLLDAVDEVRRAECVQLTDVDKQALKNTRFSLLRNPAHLKPKDVAAIARVRSTNRRLTRAYELRVDFEEFWTLDHPDDGRLFLMNWSRAALMSKLAPFRRLAKTVRARLDGILGFIRWYGLNSARSEGRNNKIKMLIHRAYGFHSAAAVLAMITLCCSGIAL